MTLCSILIEIWSSPEHLHPFFHQASTHPGDTQSALRFGSLRDIFIRQSPLKRTNHIGASRTGRVYPIHKIRDTVTRLLSSGTDLRRAVSDTLVEDVVSRSPALRSPDVCGPGEAFHVDAYEESSLAFEISCERQARFDRSLEREYIRFPPERFLILFPKFYFQRFDNEQLRAAPSSDFLGNPAIHRDTIRYRVDLDPIRSYNLDRYSIESLLIFILDQLKRSVFLRIDLSGNTLRKTTTLPRYPECNRPYPLRERVPIT